MATKEMEDFLFEDDEISPKAGNAQKDGNMKVGASQNQFKEIQGMIQKRGQKKDGGMGYSSPGQQPKQLIPNTK